MTPPEERIELAIDGMDCAGCALGIERHLLNRGYIRPTVSFATASALLSLPQNRSVEDASRDIEGLGYKVRGRVDANAIPDFQISRTFLIKLVVCLVLTLPLLLHMFLPFHWLHHSLFQLVLSTPVYLIGLHHFGKSALASIRAGLPNMDLLIVIGTTASYVYSLVGFIFQLGPDYLFFETAAAITTLVLVGNFFEERAVKKTSNAMVALSKVQATKAKRILTQIGKKSIEEIDAKHVAIDDLLQLNTGDRVPTDGIVVSGEGLADESMITGESIMVQKNAGASVIGGTILQHGSLVMRATAIGERTVLSGIIRLVKDAQEAKPKIQRLGDIVSAYFTPVAVGIAILTLILSLIFGVPFGAALLRSVAVLVIACPCAMGLATPTAVMVGVGRGTKNGILVRGGNVLEKLSQVKCVVFDKTGTLTTGEFKLNELKILKGDEESAKRLIAALESHSSHPIARSLVKNLGPITPAELCEVSETRGQGMSGKTADGKIVRLGSPRFISGTSTQQNSLLLEVDGEVIASLVIGDAPRAAAKSAITELKAMGLQTILLSGDSKEKCQLLANEVGIEQVYAERSPEEKLSVIDELQKEGLVAFVGDGINDSPALSKASVGISLGDATQAAIQAADIVLLRGDLSLLPTAYKLSRQTLKTIKQNLFWAFSYNIIAIPLAAFGFLNPMVAAFAMGFSDVMTIGNSLRLRTKKLAA